MATFAIDFALKNIRSLSKWMLQKGIDALAERVANMAFDETRKEATVILEKVDLEILEQAVNILKSDTEKMAKMLTNQAKKDLTASISHVERGLIIILVSKFIENI